MRRDTKSITIDMLMGLPGSGKTTMAKEYDRKNYDTAAVIVDEYRDCYLYTKCSQHEIVSDGVRKSLNNFQITRLIIDGLFLTNDVLIDGIKAVLDGIACLKKHDLEIIIRLHRWNEDRETCLKNDGGRRELSSSTTIMNADFEQVDFDKINTSISEYIKTKSYDFDIPPITKCISHVVLLKEDWKRYFIGHNIEIKDGYLRSEKWRTGGTAGNCWDSNLTPLSGEEPLNFNELDDLLERISPTITFLQYKKIMRECVTTEDSSEGDYYGGCSKYLNWVCDLNKLYKTLEDIGLIISEE